MHELHENEQYFFDEPTIEQLADFVATFDSPCVICAPMIGLRLTEMGIDVSILDIDNRFADLPGFRHWDLYNPKWLGQKFGLILCDPPFFNVSLSQLFSAIHLLGQHDFSQPVMIGYLKRRADAILGTFSPFGLQPTGYSPGYQTVRKIKKNEIEFFSNLPEEQVRRLRE